MGNATPSVPAAILGLYEDLLATNPRVERKGAAMPYTSMNGHMFSFLTKTGTLALRLPAEERDAFLKKYKTKLSEQHGTVLEEYVEVPETLLKKTKELKEYFDLSYAYVASLKPKPTKKKTAKKRSTEHTQRREKTSAGPAGAGDPTAEADRGRHPSFPGFNVRASGPGSIALSLAAT